MTTFTQSYTITPNDSADLTNYARALYVTVGGTVTFTTVDDITDTITVPDSFIVPGQIKRVFSTGTTATGIHSWI